MLCLNNVMCQLNTLNFKIKKYLNIIPRKSEKSMKTNFFYESFVTSYDTNITTHNDNIELKSPIQ